LSKHFWQPPKAKNSLKEKRDVISLELPMLSLHKINKTGSIITHPILGRTLPSLLDEACDYHPNHHAFNQWKNNTWQPQSSQKLRTTVEELALGLLDEQLIQADKVAFLMHSDLNFCLADFAALLAGLVNVPIDLTQTLENIVFILNHSAAKILIVADLDLLAQIIPYLKDISHLQTIIVVDIPDDWQEKRTQLLTCGVNEFGIESSQLGVNKLAEKVLDSPSSQVNVQKITPNFELRTINSPSACLCIPMLLCQARQNLYCPELPQCIQLLSLDEVRVRGQKLWSQKRVKKLRSQISPQDLATIVYIAGDSGQPKGVMLSHENITADILTTFKSIADLKLGAAETVLSFLPLTHIFARAFIYGHLNYGHSIYFSTPNRAARDFLTVQPTLVATVPRLLEKIYQKILDRQSKLKGLRQTIFNWAFNLAQNYELGKATTLSYNLQLKLANWLVFSQVRQPFGGRLKYFICGGAALKAEIANVLSAAGIRVLQGYGLTETSSVICCNQTGSNRAGTVGTPIPGAEIAIAADQEILVKAPYVMQGYYKNPEATKAVIDEQGWFHTGDLGEFTPEGFLTITGSKKNLFKLATGKYVTPQPLEDWVKRSPLVEQAVVVGMQKKFCGMLIVPDLDKLRERARTLDWYLPDTELLQQPEVIQLYQTIVDQANEQLSRWSKVQRFQLIEAHFTLDNGLLNPNLTINRAKVNEIFATEIDALYGESILSSELEVRSSELAKLTLLDKFRLASGQVLRSYFPNLRPKNLDFLQKMEIEQKQSRTAKFRTFNFEYAKRLALEWGYPLGLQTLWRRMKNYITLPSAMPWKLPENNSSEEPESEITQLEGGGYDL
jgi:long-chain acyl-CoA synthetase